MTPDEVLAILESDPGRRLTPSEAALRLKTFGPNEVAESPQRELSGAILDETPTG